MRDVGERGVAWPFWARAETLRGEQGLTIQELCSRSGVRRQTYAELKRTTRRPQRYIVSAVADTLGMDATEAMALAGLMPTDSDMVRRAILSAHDLDEAQKQSLLILLDGYDTAARKRRGMPPPGLYRPAPAPIARIAS